MFFLRLFLLFHFAIAVVFTGKPVFDGLLLPRRVAVDGNLFNVLLGCKNVRGVVDGTCLLLQQLHLTHFSGVLFPFYLLLTCLSRIRQEDDVVSDAQYEVSS